ncbi:YncE family protein [Paenibacillus sp. GP183]|uniref:YncE family protein n=1 Tax=Paenibacillus sp. GP183 TaxID=1882751 RepID=UPI00209B0083|nr:YncE family protein [Paenibacillus sp. GP183]
MSGIMGRGSSNSLFKRFQQTSMVLCCLGIALVPTVASAASDVQFNLVTTIDLPGKPGAGDVVAADPLLHKVYLSQKGNNNVIVIDTDTNTVAATVYGVNVGNGLTYNSDYIFVASEKDEAVVVISKKDWSIVKKVPTGGKAPDSINYISKENAVAVVNNGSNTMSFISAQSPFSVIATMNLKDSPKVGPDLGVYVPETNTLYQPEDNNVLVINPKTHTIGKMFTYDLPEKEPLRGLYFDSVKKILWIATKGKQMFAVDATSGNIVAKFDATAGQDQITVDLKNRILFAAESSTGLAEVIDMDAMRRLPDLYVGGKKGGSHTLDIMPDTNTIYAFEPLLNKVAVIKIEKTFPAYVLSPDDANKGIALLQAAYKATDDDVVKAGFHRLANEFRKASGQPIED